MYFRIVAVVLSAVLGSSAMADGGKPPKTDRERLSYTLGFQIGQGLKQDGFEIDAAMFSRAVGDVMKGTPPAMTPAEMQSVVTANREQRLQAKKAVGEKNQKDGQAYLAANKAKKDVVTLPNGLQYKVIKAASGEKPKPDDTVTVHYRGTLIDGTEFDSSIARGEPATFPVKGVIRGWQEILPMMPVGSKWQVFIPSDLAYGPNGAPGGKIGPNSTLVFDIELLSVKK